MSTRDEHQEALSATFVALKREVEQRPISAEKVTALSEAIKALAGINPLSLS